MIHSFLLDELRKDCCTLLNRALLGKTVSAFGVDGLGQHGTSLFAKHFKISDVNVLVHELADEVIGGYATLILDDYDAADAGHIATDNNFKISVDQHLTNELINPACWTWAHLSLQGSNYVTLAIDVRLLINW